MNNQQWGARKRVLTSTIFGALNTATSVHNEESLIQIKFYSCPPVGGGTGGSVLIHELLQHNALNQTILLLEAGPRSYSLLDIPMLAPLLQRTRYDWQFETERQTHACWGLDNQVRFSPTTFSTPVVTL